MLSAVHASGDAESSTILHNRTIPNNRKVSDLVYGNATQHAVSTERHWGSAELVRVQRQEQPFGSLQTIFVCVRPKNVSLDRLKPVWFRA